MDEFSVVITVDAVRLECGSVVVGVVIAIDVVAEAVEAVVSDVSAVEVDSVKVAVVELDSGVVEGTPDEVEDCGSVDDPLAVVELDLVVSSSCSGVDVDVATSIGVADASANDVEG